MTEFKAKPVILICIGMAGTDPAVLKTPYEADIDIRDTLDYRKVMSTYDLGPNGAIMTSLNIFATKFDQVLDILENHLSDSVEYVVIDTPGQIEVFTWSASGDIITQALGSQFPTMLLYVVDTPKCTENVAAFMSNMLYACSIMFKSQLPLLIVFNKTDVISADTIKTWMQDYFTFQEVVGSSEDDPYRPAYLLSTIQSMGLLLEEFYDSLPFVDISVLSTGGISDILTKCQQMLEKYEQEFLPNFRSKKLKDLESHMNSTSIQ